MQLRDKLFSFSDLFFLFTQTAFTVVFSFLDLNGFMAGPTLTGYSSKLLFHDQEQFLAGSKPKMTSAVDLGPSLQTLWPLGSKKKVQWQP